MNFLHVDSPWLKKGIVKGFESFVTPNYKYGVFKSRVIAIAVLDINILGTSARSFFYLVCAFVAACFAVASCLWLCFLHCKLCSVVIEYLLIAIFLAMQTQRGWLCCTHSPVPLSIDHLCFHLTKRFLWANFLSSHVHPEF